MVSKKNDPIRQQLKYNARRTYFGKFRPDDLNRVYRVLNRAEYGNYASISVGTINGDIICRGLWAEMSLNPNFFGATSPFIFNGKNNIFRFVTIAQSNPVTENIRIKLIKFLTFNALKTSQWNDVISTDVNGDVHIMDLKSNIYLALKVLRDCIKEIAKQNVSDYDGAHRASITAAVTAAKNAAPAPQATQSNTVAQPSPAAPANATPPQPADDIDIETPAEREEELLSTITTEHYLGQAPDDFANYMEKTLGQVRASWILKHR